MARQLRAVGASHPVDLGAALLAALDGSGPALLPLPEDAPLAARVLATMRPEEPLENDDIALVIPTTGSTGEPKGVMLTAAALDAAASATHERLGGPGQWLLALPLTHIAGIQVLVRSRMSDRAARRIAPGGQGFTDAFCEQTRILMRRDDATYTALVPTQLARLLDAGPDVRHALASYDAVLVGGAAAPSALLAAARGAGVAIRTTYGMSETAGGCVYDGLPLDGVRVRVDEGSRLRICGDQLFSGYRLRPDLTAAVLLGDELVTDDLGFISPDGRVHVTGRADDVVQVGGESVALPAVEAALLQHPGVRDAVAITIPDAVLGRCVVAIVVPRDSAPLAPEMRAWVTERVGRAAAPRRLLLRGTLPLTGPGKVDRRALEDWASALPAGRR